MAQLLTWLAGAGARTSAGDPVSSGFLWAYEPGGGTTQALIYTDVDGTVVATQPVALDEGGRATVYTIEPIRIVIQDATGADVTDKDQANVVRAEAVQIDNDFWSDTYLGDALTAIGRSTGGDDAMYKESSGATARTIKAKFSELSISVKDFGAMGDGLTVDTTAIQAAINRVAFLGGGIVYFPPGTYLIDQALTLTSKNGVSFVGAGMAATTIKSNSGTANMFTLSTCKSITFEGFECENTASSTGSIFALTTCTGVRFVDIGSDGISLSSPGGFYRYGMNLTTCGYILMDGCRILAKSTDAAGRCLLTLNTGTILVNGGFYSANTYNWEFTGTQGAVTSVNVAQSGGFIRFALGLAVAPGFTFVGGSGQGFSIATATIPRIRLINAYSITASATSSATGAAQTPSLIDGNEVILTAASGVAGIVTVNAPAILPGTSTDDVDWYWDFVFKNAAGGAVTWTLDPVFVTTAAIPATPAHTISVRFRWDRTTSKLREVSRADTVT